MNGIGCNKVNPSSRSLAKETTGGILQIKGKKQVKKFHFQSSQIRNYEAISMSSCINNKMPVFA
jgi:hypothetical protein